MSLGSKFGKECLLVVIENGNLGGGANKLELSITYEPLSIVEENESEKTKTAKLNYRRPLQDQISVLQKNSL